MVIDWLKKNLSKKKVKPVLIFTTIYAVGEFKAYKLSLDMCHFNKFVEKMFFFLMNYTYTTKNNSLKKLTQIKNNYPWNFKNQNNVKQILILKNIKYY